MKRGSLFETVQPSAEEFTEILKSFGQVRIERIVSHGHVSPPGFWYDQDDWEYVAVLQGSAELQTESEKFTMNAGDWVMIPAHERHRVIYTSTEPPCVWLAIFGRD